MADATEFHVEVVKLDNIQKHPNADTLSYTEVPSKGGYPVVFRTEDYRNGDLAVYVPVDAWVPTALPEFSFLYKEGATQHRTKAVRLRGMYSQGLLVSAARARRELGQGFKIGADVQGVYCITRYDPPTKHNTSQPPGAKVQRDPGFMPQYGLEAYRRFLDGLVDGEQVILTEKIHGMNARFCFKRGRLWVGSHRTMRGHTDSRIVEWLNRRLVSVRRALGLKLGPRREVGDVWWEIANRYGLRRKLERIPGVVLYGEIYGPGCQKLEYGVSRPALVVFDAFDTTTCRYMDHDELALVLKALDLPMVPELYRGPWHPGMVKIAEGNSRMPFAEHIREGFVVRPLIERRDPRVGRVAFKVVSEQYNLWKGANE